MPEETQELRRIHWGECFGFTQIFRTFRLAIHPSKLVLALVAILLTIAVGLVMDAIWSAAGKSVLPGEVKASVQREDLTLWRKAQIAEGEAMVLRMLADGRAVKEEKPPASFASDEDYFETLGDLPDRIEKHYEETLERIAKKKGVDEQTALCKELAPPGVTAVPPHIANDEAKLGEHAVRMARNTHKDALATVTMLEERGIFSSLLEYQRSVLRQGVDAARSLNFTGLLHDALGRRQIVGQLGSTPAPEGPGLITCLVLMALGAKWFVGQHWFYALVFGLIKLTIWSLFGGAICRIAALQAARDERIPLKAALSFARRKFIGFFAAPLIPILLVAVIGVFLILGGLVGSIPVVGEILTGVLFFLALIGGFVMALVVIGAVAGSSLMWPTIAVEGSDSFDAISRSFSYVYSKPWRSLLYFLVASVYGAICFLFVRVFILIMLKLTHAFVSIGMLPGRPAAGEGFDKLDAMWQEPHFDSLLPAWSPIGLGAIESFGGFLIFVWAGLVVATSYAFLISFYYSGSTIIYFLLRREVDATDVEDVYLEETKEDELEPAPAPAPAPAAAPASSTVPVTEIRTNVAPKPPESPPPSGPPSASGDGGSSPNGGGQG